MNSPLVSIIIPTYNRANFLRETLNSILTQTYKNWECIVVDDRSTDNTNQIVSNYIEQDERFKFYVRPCNRLRGGNAARNYGFEKSQGDYIQWFDSDDIMFPDYLQKRMDVFNDNSRVDIVFAAFIGFTASLTDSRTLTFFAFLIISFISEDL